MRTSFNYNWKKHKCIVLHTYFNKFVSLPYLYPDKIYEDSLPLFLEISIENIASFYPAIVNKELQGNSEPVGEKKVWGKLMSHW